MSEEQVGMNQERLKYQLWYHWPRCPLVPDIKFRKADKHNTWSFGFHWLIFRCWTMDNPSLGASIELDDMSLQIRLRLPYLITGLFIPVFPWGLEHKLWRKPKYEMFSE